VVVVVEQGWSYWLCVRIRNEAQAPFRHRRHDRATRAHTRQPASQPASQPTDQQSSPPVIRPWLPLCCLLCLPWCMYECGCGSRCGALVAYRATRYGCLEQIASRKSVRVSIESSHT